MPDNIHLQNSELRVFENFVRHCQILMKLNFTLGRDFALTGTLCQPKVTWRSLDNNICNQIHHILVRRHCTNVCNVKCMRGAEMESKNFFVKDKIRLKIKRSEKTRKNEIKILDIYKLNKKKVKEFIKEITANIRNTQLEEVEDLNETWNKKRGISEATGKIIGK